MSSTLLGQKQAVVNAVSNAMGSSFQSGVTLVKASIAPDQLSSVQTFIFDGIMNGSIAYTGDTSDAKILYRYINGMIQNHFRKAKELNGGVKYAPTSSSTGRRDATLLNLKKLLKTYNEGSEKFNQILTAISNREVELVEERKTSTAERKQQKLVESIDTSVLSPELASVLENPVNV